MRVFGGLVMFMATVVYIGWHIKTLMISHLCSNTLLYAQNWNECITYRMHNSFIELGCGLGLFLGVCALVFADE